MRQWRDQAGVADIKTNIAVLKEYVTDLRAKKEEGTRRWWALLPPIGGAVVNGLIAAVVAYFVARP